MRKIQQPGNEKPNEVEDGQESNFLPVQDDAAVPTPSLNKRRSPGPTSSVWYGYARWKHACYHAKQQQSVEPERASYFASRDLKHIKLKISSNS